MAISLRQGKIWIQTSYKKLKSWWRGCAYIYIYIVQNFEGNRICLNLPLHNIYNSISSFTSLSFLPLKTTPPSSYHHSLFSLKLSQDQQLLPPPPPPLNPRFISPLSFLFCLLSLYLPPFYIHFCTFLSISSFTKL